MKIHLILVYWVARNSLSYNPVLPFKDGVTFVVTTATQSLQRSYLESVADMSYVAINVCHFLSKISKFWVENSYSIGPEAIGGHWGSKRRSKTQFYSTQNHQKSLEVNKVCTLICCTDCVLILFPVLWQLAKRIEHYVNWKMLDRPILIRIILLFPCPRTR